MARYDHDVRSLPYFLFGIPAQALEEMWTKLIVTVVVTLVRPRLVPVSSLDRHHVCPRQLLGHYGHTEPAFMFVIGVISGFGMMCATRVYCLFGLGGNIPSAALFACATDAHLPTCPSPVHAQLRVYGIGAAVALLPGSNSFTHAVMVL